MLQAILRIESNQRDIYPAMMMVRIHVVSAVVACRKILRKRRRGEREKLARLLPHYERKFCGVRDLLLVLIQISLSLSLLDVLRTRLNMYIHIVYIMLKCKVLRLWKLDLESQSKVW